MKNKKILSIALTIVFVFVIGLAIAFSALSTTLNAKFNTVTSQALSLNVSFNESWLYTRTDSKYSDYYKNTKYGTWTSGTATGGAVCGDVLIEGNSIYANDIELSSYGDKCTYNLRITNSGNVNAKLSSISPIRPSLTSGSGSCSTSGATMTCGSIVYKLVETSGSSLSTNTTISSGDSKNINLVVENTGGSVSSYTAWSGGGFDLTYSQA